MCQGVRSRRLSRMVLSRILWLNAMSLFTTDQKIQHTDDLLIKQSFNVLYIYVFESCSIHCFFVQYFSYIILSEYFQGTNP